MALSGINDLAGLDDHDLAVLKAIEPGYDVLVLIVPGAANVNDFAAASALAVLKKRGWVKFDGRGRTKSVHLTPDGEAAYAKATAP